MYGLHFGMVAEESLNGKVCGILGKVRAANVEITIWSLLC